MIGEAFNVMEGRPKCPASFIQVCWESCEFEFLLNSLEGHVRDDDFVGVDVCHFQSRVSPAKNLEGDYSIGNMDYLYGFNASTSISIRW
jgi:hypothetical protein